MEALALKQPTAHPLPSSIFRFQSDERLIASIRRGQPKAFEALVKRYQSRLLSFCTQMVNNPEDAEDIVQDVFASAYSAIFADSRPIHVRPWLYRIARNRCLNHLRRPVPAGQESMDVFEQDGGTTTVDRVHTREEFRHLVSDVRELPDSQRRALLLREVNTLSYEEIASEMDTSVSSVKSLLARARTSLGEAAEARILSCDDARTELDREIAREGKLSATTRRHLKRCQYCRRYRSRLRKPNFKAAALFFPFFPIGALKKLVSAKVTAAGGAQPAVGGAGAIGGGVSVGTAGGLVPATTAGGPISAAAAGVVPAGAGVVASKAAVGIVAAGLATAGAYETKQFPPAQTAVEKASINTGGSAQQGNRQSPSPLKAKSGGHPAQSAGPSRDPHSPWGVHPFDEERANSTPTAAGPGGTTTPSHPNMFSSHRQSDMQGSGLTTSQGEGAFAPEATAMPHTLRSTGPYRQTSQGPQSSSEQQGSDALAVDALFAPSSNSQAGSGWQDGSQSNRGGLLSVFGTPTDGFSTTSDQAQGQGLERQSQQSGFGQSGAQSQAQTTESVLPGQSANQSQSSPQQTASSQASTKQQSSSSQQQPGQNTSQTDQNQQSRSHAGQQPQSDRQSGTGPSGQSGSGQSSN